MTKKKVLDYFKLKAAKHFGIKYEDVTPEQRRVGKHIAFLEAYGLK